MVKKILLLIGILGVGAAIGRWTSPTKIEVKEHIVYQEKIVEKKVYVKDTQQKNNKVTIKLVTILPDGTKKIETKIFDRSEIEITSRSDTNTETNTTIDSSKETVTEYSKPEWFFSGMATTNSTYGLGINKQFLGPIFLGGFGFTDRTLGLSVGLSF